MIKFVRGFFLLLVFHFACKLFGSSEYFYPIANLRDDFFLMMYQKSSLDLEVWICNTSNGMGYKELSAFFFPSCVQLLPDKSGFSFIDRGKIRIKYFEKRAVHTLSIPDSIFRVVYMRWIDQNSFYMTAQESDFFKTYYCIIQDREVVAQCLQPDLSANFFYPTMIDHVLFCMQKNIDSAYAIVKKDCSDSAKSLFQLLHESREPICDLQVTNDGKTCFFVVVNEKFDNDPMLHFQCRLLQCDIREVKKLFDFCLPKTLITGFEKQRVFESLSPFLPYITKSGIYFSHAKPYCSLYFYDFEKQDVSKVITDQDQANQVHIFAPLIFEKNFICGLGVQDQELADQVSGHCTIGKVKKAI